MNNELTVAELFSRLGGKSLTVIQAFEGSTFLVDVGGIGGGTQLRANTVEEAVELVDNLTKGQDS
jgi:hypothetical protein